MVQEFIPTSPTQTVVTRLYDEGWRDCQDLGFPALCQVPAHNLRSFILAQLQQSDGWMWQQDLELATLIFSIPDHEFRIHPHLDGTLQRLKAERVVNIHGIRQAMTKFERLAIIKLTQTESTQN